MDTKMTRRSFVEATAVAAATLGAAGYASTAVAEEASGLPEGFVEVAPLIDPDFSSDLDMMRASMTYDELYKLRREAIDACEDYTCADGTVIPKIWVQVREVNDGLGWGCGASHYVDDQSFDAWMTLCNHDEELAQVYVNSPIGKRFTAFDASVATGLPEEACAEALKALAFNGLMFHVEIAGVDFYSHQRMAHGVTESSMNLYPVEGFIPSYMHAMIDTDNGRMPYASYYPLPVNKDVVVEGQVIPYDDIEALLERHEIFAASPCQCVYLTGSDPTAPDIHDHEAIANHVLPDGVHLQKCYTFGEEAQFYIEQGIGVQVTRDEMRELIKRSVDEGCMLQSCYTKYTEVICSCNRSGCGGMHPLYAPGNPTYYANLNHYKLLYSQDECLKCGACADRCVMGAITINDEGYPEVTGVCGRCGQCCYICPAEARKLTARKEEEMPYLPDDLLEWSNADMAYRYGKGLWPKQDA